MRDLIKRYIDARFELSNAKSAVPRAEEKLAQCVHALTTLTRHGGTTGDPLWDAVIYNSTPDDFESAIRVHDHCADFLSHLADYRTNVVIFVQTRIEGDSFSLQTPRVCEDFGFWKAVGAGPYTWEKNARTSSGMQYVSSKTGINLGMQPDQIGASLQVKQHGWENAHPVLMKLYGSPGTCLRPREIYQLQQEGVIRVEDTRAAKEWKQFCFTLFDTKEFINQHPHTAHVRRVYKEACAMIAEAEALRDL